MIEIDIAPLERPGTSYTQRDDDGYQWFRHLTASSVMVVGSDLQLYVWRHMLRKIGEQSYVTEYTVEAFDSDHNHLGTIQRAGSIGLIDLALCVRLAERLCALNLNPPVG